MELPPRGRVCRSLARRREEGIGRCGALLPLFRLVGVHCVAALWRVESLPRHRGDRPKTQLKETCSISVAQQDGSPGRIRTIDQPVNSRIWAVPTSLCRSGIFVSERAETLAPSTLLLTFSGNHSTSSGNEYALFGVTLW